jgi:hypothetical protein
MLAPNFEFPVYEASEEGVKRFPMRSDVCSEDGCINALL